MRKTLVIMAAGMGSRYGGLKQLDAVGPSGEIIMEYSIYDARLSGFDKIVFIIKEEHESLFRKVVGDRLSRFIEVAYVHQKLGNLPVGYRVPEGRIKPWGTAHAVMNCLGVVNEPFAVINADDFYGREAFHLLSGWLDTVDSSRKPEEYCMAGYILKNTLTDNGYVSRGVCRVDSRTGLLEDVTERTKIVSMNCWCFPPSFLQQISRRFTEFLDQPDADLQKAEFFLPFVIQKMVDQGLCTVRVLPTHERWFGVTYRADKETVIRAISQKVEGGVYPARLWDGLA